MSVSAASRRLPLPRKALGRAGFVSIAKPSHEPTRLISRGREGNTVALSMEDIVVLDEYNLKRGGLFGASGTVVASAGVSVIAGMVANPSPPAWAWFLSVPLIGIGLGLWVSAYFFWSRGLNPKPPRNALPIDKVMEITSRWFPRVAYFQIGTAFLQDARNGRHKIWGRRDEPLKGLELFFGGYELLPLVFIPREYWTDAKIDWLHNKTEPVSEHGVVFRGLIIRKNAYMLTVLLDRLRRRFRCAG